MKRFHVHLCVADLPSSIGFYSQLFATAPTVHKPDYAKWMLDDPRVNFAISQRGANRGIDHLGLQVDDAAELQTLHAQLAAADLKIASQGAATCCYAVSDKHWVTDPDGIAWESFHSLAGVPMYGDDLGPQHANHADPHSGSNEQGGQTQAPGCAAAVASGARSAGACC